MYNTDYTCVLYTHDCVNIHHGPPTTLEDGGYYKSIIATDTIKANKLLAVEMVINGTEENVIKAIQQCKRLQKLLYPRQGEHILVQKAQKNKHLFVGSENSILGPLTSCFNHNGQPNAAMDFIGKPVIILEKEKETYSLITFSRIWSLRNILPKEEICISYGTDLSPFHEFISETDASPIVPIPETIRTFANHIIDKCCKFNDGETSSHMCRAHDAQRQLYGI